MNPEYGPLGLNQTLRIDGVGYIYDPQTNAWHDQDGDALFAEEIHAMILEGPYKVRVWEDLR